MKSLLFFFSALSLFSLSSWASDDEFDYPNTPLPTPKTPHYPLYDGLSNTMEITSSKKRKNQDYIQATILKKVKLKKNNEKKNVLELLINDIAEKASEDSSLIMTYKGGVQKMAIGWWDSEEYGMKKMFPGTQLTQGQKQKAGKKTIELYNQKVIKQQQILREEQQILREEQQILREEQQRLREEKQRLREEKQRLREEQQIKKDINFSEIEKEKIIIRMKDNLLNSRSINKDFYMDILNHHEEIGLFNTRANDNWYTDLGFSEKYQISISSRGNIISKVRNLILKAANDLNKEETIELAMTTLSNEAIPSPERIVIEEVLP